MNKNIKVAKQLLKLAKSLVSYKQDKTITKLKIKDLDDLKKINDLSNLTQENLVEISQLFYGIIIYKLENHYKNIDFKQEAKDIKQQFFIRMMELFNKNKIPKKLDKANANTYFSNILKYVIFDYIRKNFHLETLKKMNIKLPFFNVNSFSNYADKNKSTLPGHQMQKKQLKKQLYSELFNKLNELKKENGLNFKIISLYFYHKLTMEEIVKEVNKNLSYVNRTITNFKKELNKDKDMKQKYQEYKFGPKDTIKLSSDFIQEMLWSEEMWKEYFKNN